MNNNYFKKTKTPYDISINKECDKCIFRGTVIMRCEEHINHYKEHWYRQTKSIK